MYQLPPLLDIWVDLAKLFQDSKTWDFIINVGYAAAIGLGGFVVRKFGLKIRKNATAIGEITTDVLSIAQENESLKSENTKLKADLAQSQIDFSQQKETYRMLETLFDLSKTQWNGQVKGLQQELDTAKLHSTTKTLPEPSPVIPDAKVPEMLPAPHSIPVTKEVPKYDDPTQYYQ